jgi:hypothetical protein
MGLPIRVLLESQLTGSYEGFLAKRDSLSEMFICKIGNVDVSLGEETFHKLPVNWDSYWKSDHAPLVGRVYLDAIGPVVHLAQWYSDATLIPS